MALTTAAKPILVWETLFTSPSAIITFSSEAANKPVSNLSDFFLFTFWGPTTADQSGDSSSHVRIELPSAQDFDILVIANHDLNTAGITVKLNHHQNNTFASATQILTNTPADDENLYIEFTLENRQFIELVFDGSATAFSIGQIFLAKKLTMERRPVEGFDWLAREGILQGKTTKKGQYISAVQEFVNRGFSMDFEDLSRSFITSGDFLNYIDESFLFGLPFFLIPDKTNFASYIFYMHPVQPRFSAPTVTQRHNFSMFIEGAAQGLVT